MVNMQIQAYMIMVYVNGFFSFEINYSISFGVNTQKNAAITLPDGLT